MGRHRRRDDNRGRNDHRPPRREPRPYVPPSIPLAAEGGIKAATRNGEFGTSWWAKRWQAVLEGFRFGARLARGRSYARDGQVLSIDVGVGEVTASVQGSRPDPYDVSIRVKALTERQWAEVVTLLSKQAIFVAKLLAGEMPDDIERVFDQAGHSLFPEKGGDLRTECSCPDQANPCKHIAAVYYLLGEEFDRDPFLIFRLRGLERSKLAEKLSPGRKEPPAPKAQLREEIGADARSFWELPALGDDVLGEAVTPSTTAALVRRLGAFPFWRAEKPLLQALEPAYVDASAAGLKSFLGEKPEKK
ncbi:MAG: SWIM zinc finger family protein [Gemmataceae bacterium]|nr:SWIM zinc finger family protein [Gemmataceae bacterium]